MKALDAVVEILKREGVELLFGYPMNNLIEAAAIGGIRPIIARTEKSLINMADGYSRATNGRKIGVITVQAGPGIENAFGGIAQAYADGSPLLVLPGGGDMSKHGLGGEFDPMPSFRHITKWSARIPSADRVPVMLRHAFAQLRSGRPGPVMLELPRDVAANDLSTPLSYTPPPFVRSGGDAVSIGDAAKRLIDASRPVIHVGHGVLWSEATAELRELVELLDAPVVTTIAGKSAFPENHRLSAGAGGLSIAHAAARALRDCDVIFGIGCSFAQGSFSPPIPPGKTVIHATNDPADLDRHVEADLAIVGDARVVLRQLIEAVHALLSSGQVIASREAFHVAIEEARHNGVADRHGQMTATTLPINPYRVIAEVMRAVNPDETIVTHDSGNPRDQVLPTWISTSPRGYVGWGKSTQLGTGLGIIMGAKLAHPEKLCINFMGDLAFGTAAIELETAVRERIGTLTVLLNNSVMGGYTAHMPTASATYRSNRLSGDYTAVALALGAHAERVDQPGDLAAAIARAIQATRAGQPALIEAITKEEPVYLRARDAVLGAIR